MDKQHLLLGETAKLLGVKPYRLAYALSTSLVEEPKLRISNKRIFQIEDILRLANYFGVTINNQGESNGRDHNR